MSTLLRRTAAAAFAATALAVAGCSSADEDATAASSTEGFPRTVTHFRGVTEIPEQPQRVVALDTSFTDAVLLLETPLVGYVDYRESGFPEYVGDAGQEFGADAEPVGKVSEASLEKVVTLEPDLILSADVRDGDRYDQLSEIAPTVFTETTGPTWKENIRLVGQALGKEELAEQKISEYEERARAIGDEINAKENNPTVSVVRFAGEPTARLYRTTSFSGIVLEDAGLARPDSQGPDPADPANIMNSISPELIDQADADVIFVSTYQDGTGQTSDAARPFLESPLWAQLDGRTVDVDDTLWMTPVSIQGAHKILDDLADAFGVDRHEI
ncbi:iron complex transport system substrate-binding protein [Rhodococcus triatomae]|uniref:Iron complex transport system substrate-binding protein n=1 Tax=Rhodococcus triatomae TaxID=300028 RepID=A0A1G8EVL9_9NOCA|nr:iron-siderophore ABC transporter substrate-binding protein [Rhodococcus triatomae]SDH73885.1 iron complex transport system substrate-binding protein [Rhodococcus triatomae]